MSALEAHLDLFKADWIADPELLAKRIREASVSDRYTAELAAWCAEIHEHLRELADELDIGLLLMGGNGASLRSTRSASAVRATTTTSPPPRRTSIA